ncbi:MAG: potassium channel family protein [Thermodesulfobacteriota bacterium]|nr:potassium channel family protein [Thermodesulfobacteriota bacterium]
MSSVAFRLRVFLVVLFAVMLLGTIGFMVIENLSLEDALYFSIVTVATVGYGDIHPATPMGKIFAIFLIITGVGTFLGVIANATEIMLNRREKRSRLQKLNMVVGLFFSEIGTTLLAHFSTCDPGLETIRKKLIVSESWSEKDFSRVSQELKGHKYTVHRDEVKLEAFRAFLEEKADLLLRLLENPVLLEHESFTELLWAVFHIKEELLSRDHLGGLPDTDRAHLAADISRAYTQLVHQWLDYMKYLHHHYPYLFSLAMRTNPFDKEASPIVK